MASLYNRNVERFQGSSNSLNSSGTNLDEAYVAGSPIANIIKPITDNSVEGETVDEKEAPTGGSTTILQGSKSMGFPETIWHFLGLHRLSKTQRDCSFDCGMKGLNCSTKCENEFTPKKRKLCKYRCLQKGLKCTKNCVETPDTPITQPVTTSPIATTMTTMPTTMAVNNYSVGLSASQAQNNTVEEQQQIDGVCNCDDYSAPYQSNLWPSKHQVGWDNQTLKNYRKNQSDEQIEVLVNSNLFPLTSTPNPELVFEGDSRFKFVNIELKE